MNNQIKEAPKIKKIKIVLTDAEKKLKRSAYYKQYRLDNLDTINAKRKAKAPRMAELQRKYDNAKRKDPDYIEKLNARQKRYRDKLKNERVLLKQYIAKDAAAQIDENIVV
jgi:hypothetical protein